MKSISAYHHQRCESESHSDEVYSIQNYVIKFFSDLRKIKKSLLVHCVGCRAKCNGHRSNKYMNDTVLEDVLKHKHLGINVCPNGTCKDHINEIY